MTSGRRGAGGLSSLVWLTLLGPVAALVLAGMILVLAARRNTGRA